MKFFLQDLNKTVRGILNKLTPSKFDKLLQRIQSLDISTEERLASVIKLFFEKAVDEPIFSPTYAKMCQALSAKEVASSTNPAETTNFRKLLLTRCQREFEKDSAGLVDVENKKKEIEANEDVSIYFQFFSLLSSGYFYIFIFLFVLFRNLRKKSWKMHLKNLLPSIEDSL